jgi:hypothetical protein
MRQDQKYLADASAAELAGPTDYAALLVTWALRLADAERIPVSTTAAGIVSKAIRGEPLPNVVNGVLARKP